MNFGRRMPSVPEFLPTSPAPAAPLPSALARKVDADHESCLVDVPCPNSTRVPVYTTSKRWKAIDVYLAQPTFALGAGAVLRVHVYAVTEGVRTLVGTGCYRDVPIVPSDPSQWLVAVRQAADRYDVELSYNDLPGSETDRVQLAVVASDEAQDSPLVLGAMAVGPTTNLISNVNAFAVLAPSDPLELVGLTAAAIVPQRYLHVHDLGSTAAVAGAAPRMVIGFPSVGSSVDVEPSALMRAKRFSNGVCLAISTTPGETTLAGVGDVAFQGWVR